MCFSIEYYIDMQTMCSVIFSLWWETQFCSSSGLLRSSIEGWLQTCPPLSIGDKLTKRSNTCSGKVTVTVRWLALQISHGSTSVRCIGVKASFGNQPGQTTLQSIFAELSFLVPLFSLVFLWRPAEIFAKKFWWQEEFASKKMTKATIRPTKAVFNVLPCLHVWSFGCCWILL